jgi:hypothetical protein
MAGFVAGTDWSNRRCCRKSPGDRVDERNPIRVIDAFVDASICGNWVLKARILPRPNGRRIILLCTSTLHLWLPQSRAVEPPARTRGVSQSMEAPDHVVCSPRQSHGLRCKLVSWRHLPACIVFMLICNCQRLLCPRPHGDGLLRR